MRDASVNKVHSLPGCTRQLHNVDSRLWIQRAHRPGP